MESQAQLQKQEGVSSASCCTPGRKRSSGGSYKAGAVRNRAAEKGRNRDERNRASEQGRTRAGEQRKTGWKAATKAAAKEGIDVTKKANILCQEEEQQERGGNKQKEEQRKCNSAFGCGKIFCDQCYPPGDALGRRG